MGEPLTSDEYHALSSAVAALEDAYTALAERVEKLEEAMRRE